MELLEYRWLFYAVVIGYSLVLPLYNHRKKLKDKLVSTKFSFSITDLLFLTLIVALCVHVGLEWKRYSNAWQENKRFNDAARYARSIGNDCVIGLLHCGRCAFVRLFCRDVCCVVFRCPT